MDPFIGEVIMFAGNFAPRGWAFCDGALLPISQNQALFSILGTTYGGDGRTTFALPDLRGRAPIHEGTGPGLTNRRLGQNGGAESVTLSISEMPAHDHTAQQPGTSAGPTTTSPQNAIAATLANPVYNQGGPVDANMAVEATGTTGGTGSHPNMPPFLVLNYIIALQGTYPSRS